MTTVLYIYDVDGWALHNIGKLLQNELADDMEVSCVSQAEFQRRPRGADVIYCAYPGTLPRGVDLGTFCQLLVTTVHDPCEVSYFTDRFSWTDGPFAQRDYAAFDRVSSTCASVTNVLKSAYQLDPWLTPTMPHDRQLIMDVRNQVVRDEPTAPQRIPRFTSSHAGGGKVSWARVASRFLQIDHYTRDQTGRRNLSQMRSIFVRPGRKNKAWLDALASEPSVRDRVEFHFRSQVSPLRMTSREQYVRELVRNDVYVCTSYMEGGPLTVMEAVIAGLAVISTPVGQVEQWVEHGRNGFIVRNYDELVAATRTYAEDAALLAAHRAHSISLANERSFDRAAWLRFLSP